jgi:hypothetical protein
MYTAGRDTEHPTALDRSVGRRLDQVFNYAGSDLQASLRYGISQ